MYSIGCQTRLTKRLDQDSAQGLRVGTTLPLLFLSLVSFFLCALHPAFLLLSLGLIVVFVLLCTFFNLVQYAAIKMDERSISFPACMLKPVAGDWPLKLGWSDIRMISADYNSSNEVCCFHFVKQDGTVLKFFMAENEMEGAGLLDALGIYAEAKFSPDLLGKHQERRADSFARGLMRLAERSEEDRQVVEMILRKTAGGASAKEIMDAQFEIRFGKRDEQDFSPPEEGDQVD